jgi:two-component system heavy metal sensor histidine kinase CusS
VWQTLSLNKKLLILLISVQAVTLSLGVFVLLQWIASKRIDDLYVQADNRSDSLEDLVTIENGQWLYRNNTKGESEIYHDPQFHFVFKNSINQTVIQSDGQNLDSRHQLDRHLSTTAMKDGDFNIFTINKEKWLFERTDIRRNIHNQVVTGTLYVGLNINNAAEEIDQLRHLAVALIFSVIFLTAGGSYLVVNYLTRNLKRFSHNIRDLQPPHFSGKIQITPQSAEEKLLFDSYDSMITLIQSAMENQRLFIANASHEFKTPIAAATAALEVILSRPRTAEDYESTCRDVMAELQVLRRLSNNLLNISRLDESDNFQHQQSELSAVLPRVIARWQKQAEQKQIQLSCEINAVQTKSISGSVEVWEVIIGNLLDNAIKYGRHNGNVWITAVEADNSTLEICISDDGIGMTLLEIEQLGKVFFRADQARSGFDSFGLGFAHAKRLLESLGGRISTQQNSAGGVQFTLTLPF